MLLGSSFVWAQNQCEVLEKDIVGEYEGGCKKGLANGKSKARVKIFM